MTFVAVTATESVFTAVTTLDQPATANGDEILVILFVVNNYLTVVMTPPDSSGWAEEWELIGTTQNGTNENDGSYLYRTRVTNIGSAPSTFTFDADGNFITRAYAAAYADLDSLDDFSINSGLFAVTALSVDSAANDSTLIVLQVGREDDHIPPAGMTNRTITGFDSSSLWDETVPAGPTGDRVGEDGVSYYSVYAVVYSPGGGGPAPTNAIFFGAGTTS